MNKYGLKQKAGDEGDGEWEFPMMSSPRLKVEKLTSHSHFYQINFDEYIREPSYYRDVVKVISEAAENDVIELVMNSPGGNLSSAGAIIQAIQNSDAEIFASIVGDCHSAASMIALSCNNIKVGPFANMMCHEARFGAYGPSSTVYSQVEFSKKYLTRIIKEVYKDYLSEVEIEQILTGSEIWLDAQDIGKRLKYMFEQRSEEVEAQVALLELELAKLKESSDTVEEKPQQVKKVPRKRATKQKQ